MPYRKSFFPLILMALAFAGRAEVNSVAGLANPLGNSGGTARATAMGSAYVAVAQDSSALLWNPAGLAGLNNFEMGLHHNSWLAGIAQETLVAGVPLAFGGLGLSVNYINFGSMAAYDSGGNAAGVYGASELGAGAGWGMEILKGLEAGVAFRGESLTINGDSYGDFSGDLGLSWKVAGLRLAADYSNLGSPVAGSSLASAFRLGASTLLAFNRDNSLLLAAGTQLEPQGVSRVQVGIEETLYRVAALRLGFEDSLADNQIHGLSGLTAGIGFSVSVFVLDYAYLPFGDLGAAQRLSLSYHFDPLPGTESRPPAAPPAGLGEDALATGRKLEAAGRWREAVVAYNEAIRKNRDDSSAWRAAGALYYRMGKKEYAVSCFDQVLRLSPGDTALKAWLEGYRR